MQTTVEKAVEQAYKNYKAKNWNRIYWAIDLHGTCIEANYQAGVFKFLDPLIPEVLKFITSFPENRIIIFSSCYQDEQDKVFDMFKEKGVSISAFNENTDVKNTTTGCFDKKFFYSILLDDKAGFDYKTDWYLIPTAIETYRKKYLT